MGSLFGEGNLASHWNRVLDLRLPNAVSPGPVSHHRSCHHDSLQPAGRSLCLCLSGHRVLFLHYSGCALCAQGESGSPLPSLDRTRTSILAQLVFHVFHYSQHFTSCSLTELLLSHPVPKPLPPRCAG